MASSGFLPDSNDAFDFLAGRSNQVSQFLRLVAEEVDPEEVLERANEIIEKPPEEKYNQPGALFNMVFDVEGDLLDLDLSDLPANIRFFFEGFDKKEDFVNLLLNALVGVFRQKREEMQQQLLERPPGTQGYLILSVLMQNIEKIIRYIADRIYYEDNDEIDVELLASLYNVQASHLLLIIEGEKDRLYPELIKDVFRFPFYFEQAIADGREFEYDPEDIPVEQMYQEILVWGAVDAYQELEITVSRGAELAELPREEFEQQLAARGIRPNYGPESGEGLNEEIEL